MTPDQSRLDRLPAWARTYIERLERERDDARRDRDEARLATDPHESDAVLDPWAAIPVGLGKGRDARVRFRIGNEDIGEYADVHVSDDGRGRALEVMGGATLRIVPQVTNVVRIEVVR